MCKHLTLTIWPLNIRYATKIIEINTGLWLVLSTFPIYFEKCEMQITSHQKSFLPTAMFPPPQPIFTGRLKLCVLSIDDSTFRRLPTCQKMINDVYRSSDAWMAPPKQQGSQLKYSRSNDQCIACRQNCVVSKWGLINCGKNFVWGFVEMLL